MYFITKTFFDKSLALILFIVFSPLLVIISLTILLIDGWPILFLQRRGGLHQKGFNIIKFRTMVSEDKSTLNKNDDKKRTTSIGFFLRKYSLDELPSLINVLKGDMSFVGPRPLLEEYNKIYNNDQRKRFNVKPGITGWAQINGRNSISWEEKFILDEWYVENKSILLDVRIILKTIIKIIINNDVDSSHDTTMTKFIKKEIEK